MKIEDGLYKVDDVRGVNVYVVETGKGLAVIDTGMPGGAKKIAAFIERLGRRLDEVVSIVITHSDPDHVGGAAELKALTGAPIAISAEDAAVLAGAPSPKIGRTLLGRLVSGFFKTEPAEADELLDEGSEVAGFRVMCVPGHTPGSIALVRGDGVVVTGDTVLGGRDGTPLHARAALSADIGQALESYERIMKLGPRLVLPGHGAPVRLR